MDGTIWGVLVLILVLLLIMLIASWRSTDEIDERDVGANDLSPTFAHAAADEPQRPVQPPEPGQCPDCGTENDPFYTYCRECVTQLP